MNSSIKPCRETYKQLLSSGKRSADEALRSAAVFEEISIIDLEKLIAVTNMDDIRTAFEGLLARSEKHLRPYMNVLAEHKISISCRLSQPRGVDRIVKLHKPFIFQEQELKESSKRGV